MERSPARNGALLLVGVGGLAGIVLLAAGLTQGSTPNVVGAMLLIVLLAASGAVGGWVYGRLAKGGATTADRAILCWAISAATAIVVLVAGFLPLSTMLQMSGGAAYRVSTLFQRGPAIALAAVVVLFAVIASKTTARGSAAARSATPLIAWGVVLLVWSMSGFLFQTSEIPVVEDSASAARVVDYARVNAQQRPRDPQAVLAYGTALMRLDRNEEALPVLEAAVRLDSSNAFALVSLGWLLNDAGRYDEALRHLEIALRLDPTYVDAISSLGRAQYGLRRWGDAERTFRRGIRQEPNNAWLHRELSWVVHNRGEDSLALVAIQQAIALDPARPSYHTIAAMLLRSKADFAEAALHLDEALRLDPQYADAWLHLGTNEYRSGNAAASAKAFAEAYRLDSTLFRSRPMERLMWESAKQGRTGEVIEAGKPTLVRP